MDDTDPITITLTREEWRTIQTALDSHYYETEHAGGPGITRATRQQRAEDRQMRLRALEAIDRKIGEATSDGPVFG